MAEANFNESMMEAISRELKMENQSPTQSARFSFSRTSSTGSVHQVSNCCSSASSAQNTDDEDSDSNTKPSRSYKDRRREAHTQAEQKRRDAIKKGYDELQMLVPTCQTPNEGIGSQKISKATVLQRSVDYIQFLTQQKKKQEEELEKLRKDVMGLKIMKANYEHIVTAHQSAPQAGQNQVSDEVKFQVFQQIMDMLFTSFNASISVANFAELSACVFSWLEEYCKPQTLRELTMSILRQTNNGLHS